jgi:predicted permease
VLTLLSVILPVFAAIGAGLLARRLRLADQAAFRAMTDVCFFLAMPPLLFGAIVQGPAVDLLGVASVYFAACLLVYALGLLAARLLRRPLAHGAMLGLDGCYGNTVMMGIPVTVAALGPAALSPLMAIIALHSAILLTLTTLLMEAGAAGGQRPAVVLRNTLRGTLRNPIIMSICAAFLWRGLGLPVPGLLLDTLRLPGAAAVPLALICLGGSLPAPRAGAVGVEALLGAVLKLALMPALVWTIGRQAGLAELPLQVATITAGLPTGANAFLLARRAEHLMAISATTVVLTTLVSLGTLGVLLSLVL